MRKTKHRRRSRRRRSRKMRGGMFGLEKLGSFFGIGNRKQEEEKPVVQPSSEPQVTESEQQTSVDMNKPVEPVIENKVGGKRRRRRRKSKKRGGGCGCAAPMTGGKRKRRRRTHKKKRKSRRRRR